MRDVQRIIQPMLYSNLDLDTWECKTTMLPCKIQRQLLPYDTYLT